MFRFNKMMNKVLHDNRGRGFSLAGRRSLTPKKINLEEECSMTTPSTTEQTALTTQGTSAVATINAPSFNLPMLADVETAALAKEVFVENLSGGAKLQLDRFKIPSGGGLAFEVPGPDGEAEPMKEIVGVIVDYHAICAYWKDKYDGQKNPPDCASKDGKVGEGSPGGVCAKCPLNQYGSDIKADGSHGAGKACKNGIRFAVVREGEMLPLLGTLPPTSIKNYNTYITRLMSKMTPYYGAVTKIKLEKDKNADGIEFSKATFVLVAKLEKLEMATMKGFAESLRPYIRNLDITQEDYEVSSEASSGAGQAAATYETGTGGAVGNPGEAY